MALETDPSLDNPKDMFSDSTLRVVRCFIFLVSPLFFSVLSSGGELYKWKDEEGIVHMTDTLSQVPPQYRNQVEKKSFEMTPHPDMTPESSERPSRNSAGRPSGNLKHFEIPYQAFEGASRRIIIPVTFNESVTAHLLLDTGSPGLMISPELAARLGFLDEQSGGLVIMTGGIGGSVPAILAVVDSVRVGDASAEFLPATITKMPSKEFEGLVGMDFIANYRISIDSNNSVMILDELPAQSDRPGGHDEAWWRSNFERFSKLKTAWAGYLNDLEKMSMTTSERERRTAIAKKQFDEADKLCRRMERYARDNTVPMQWRLPQ